VNLHFHRLLQRPPIPGLCPGSQLHCIPLLFSRLYFCLPCGLEQRDRLFTFYSIACAFLNVVICSCSFITRWSSTDVITSSNTSSTTFVCWTRTSIDALTLDAFTLSGYSSVCDVFVWARKRFGPRFGTVETRVPESGHVLALLKPGFRSRSHKARIFQNIRLLNVTSMNFGCQHFCSN